MRYDWIYFPFISSEFIVLLCLKLTPMKYCMKNFPDLNLDELKQTMYESLLYAVDLRCLNICVFKGFLVSTFYYKRLVLHYMFILLGVWLIRVYNT